MIHSPLGHGANGVEAIHSPHSAQTKWSCGVFKTSLARNWSPATSPLPQPQSPNRFPLSFPVSEVNMPTSFLSAQRRGWTDSVSFADREAILPYPVTHYASLQDQYLDARRFASIPTASRRLSNSVTARGQADAWKARWLHLPRVTPEDTTTDPCDMPFLRCPEERGYQKRLATMMDSFLKSGGKMVNRSLDIVQFDRPFDQAYWLRRPRWAEEIVGEVRLRQRADHFWVLWHQVEFHDVPPHRRAECYAPVPPWWRDYNVHMGLCVPGPPIYAYCSHIFFSKKKDFVALACQVALCEWLVQVVVAFVDAAYYGVREYMRVADPRLYHDYRDKSCRGRLFQLPPKVIAGIRKLGVEKIFAGCVVESVVVEQLLNHVERTDWTGTPGFVWYNWEEDRVVTMPAYDGTDVTRFDAWSARFSRWKRYWYTEVDREERPLPASPMGQVSMVPTVAALPEIPEPPAEPKNEEQSLGVPSISRESGEVRSNDEGPEVIEIKDEEEVGPVRTVKSEERETTNEDPMDLLELEGKVLHHCTQASESLGLPVPTNREEMVATLAQMVKYVREVRQSLQVASSFRSMALQLRSVAGFLEGDLETLLGLTPVGSRVTAERGPAPSTQGSGMFLYSSLDRDESPAKKRQRRD